VDDGEPFEDNLNGYISTPKQTNNENNHHTVRRNISYTSESDDTSTNLADESLRFYSDDELEQLNQGLRKNYSLN
jgi:hypothetical protein